MGWSERSLKKDELGNMNICGHCQRERDSESERTEVFSGRNHSLCFPMSLGKFHLGFS